MGFTHEPVQVGLPSGTLLHHKLRMFLGHYDLRVYVSRNAWIDVDRGSFDAALMVRHVADGFKGCVGRVGQFCTFAAGSELFGGGEHWNELPVNIVLNGVPMLGGPARSVPDLQPIPAQPFNIGNAVVVSAGARVLGGVSIGDGAVVGAAALVTRDIPPFSICGGVPAKVLRQRFDATAVQAVKWWDFDLAYLSANLNRLQELAADPSASHVYRRATPRIAIRFSNETNEMSAAFLDDGQLRPITEAPPRAQAYLSHIAGPGPYYWLADMWAES